jgi:hypothetical protein
VWEALLDAPVSPAIEWAARTDPSDRSVLTVTETRDMEPGTVRFVGRLAVLVGPAAVSAGDCTPWMLSLVPGTRRFGLTTDGSCSSPLGSTLLDPGGTYEPAVTFRMPVWIARDPTDHVAVSGAKLEPEETVWLTSEDLAAGVDTVLEAAEAWILSG